MKILISPRNHLEIAKFFITHLKFKIWWKLNYYHKLLAQQIKLHNLYSFKLNPLIHDLIIKKYITHAVQKLKPENWIDARLKFFFIAARHCFAAYLRHRSYESSIKAIFFRHKAIYSTQPLQWPIERMSADHHRKKNCNAMKKKKF